MSTPESILDSPPGVSFQAERDRVDLWVIPLVLGDPEAATSLSKALDLLEPGERAIALRLRLGAEAWAAARAELRRVLAGYLGVLPTDVGLDAGPDGKPRLAAGSAIDLRFNLSHSAEVALVAVRLGHEVGVDVEAIRPGVDAAAIAREHFGPAERAALAEDGSEEGFFRAWARHEALAKATGTGISGGPDAGDASRFRVLDVDGIPGCAAAVASEGDNWSVRRT